MYYLLGVHILLGFSLLVAFVTRYVAVLTKKISPKAGRTFIAGLSAALLASGFALVAVTKAPLTGACLASLLIIAAVVTLEFGLVFVRKKLPTKD